MGAVLTLVSQLIEFYIWIVIASAVLSWLVAFDVINMRNRFVFLLGDALNRMTEPVYRRIRSVLPDMSGIDLSPCGDFRPDVSAQSDVGNAWPLSLWRVNDSTKN